MSTPTVPATALALAQINLDGLIGHADANGAALFAKVMKDLADARKTIETRDGEIAALKVTHSDSLKTKADEIETLKKAQLDDAAIEKRVEARAALIGDARRILGKDFDCAGKSDADIRKDAVMHKMGDSAKDRTAAFYDSAFEVILAQVGDADVDDDGDDGDDVTLGDTDTIRDSFREESHQAKPKNGKALSKDAALAAAQANIQDAWRGKP